MIDSGLGGEVAVTNIRDENGNALTPAYEEWAAAKTYTLDDVVKLTSGVNTTHWQAKITHQSAAADKTGASPDEVLSLTKWYSVQVGDITTLEDWAIEDTVENENVQTLREQTTRTLSHSKTYTATFNLFRQFPNPVQALLLSDYTARFDIYPDGYASGNEVISFTGSISGRGRGGSAAAQKIALTVAVESTVVEGVIA